MKVIQYYKRLPIDDRYKKHIENSKQFIPKSVEYSLISEHKYILKNLKNDFRFETDLVRLRLAIDYPDLLWIDCDAEINEWWEPPNDNISYFYFNNGVPDICVFYVNNNTKLFKEMYDFYVKNEEYMTVGWMQGYVRRSWQKYIPIGKFTHYGLGRLYGLERD